MRELLNCEVCDRERWSDEDGCAWCRLTEENARLRAAIGVPSGESLLAWILSETRAREVFYRGDWAKDPEPRATEGNAEPGRPAGS